MSFNVRNQSHLCQFFYSEISKVQISGPQHYTFEHNLRKSNFWVDGLYYFILYTVSLLYDLAGGSSCRRGPCDLHCISPLISPWCPHLSSLVRQPDLCSRPVHTWIKLSSFACRVFKMPTYTLKQRIFMYDSYVITSSCKEVVMYT